MKASNTNKMKDTLLNKRSKEQLRGMAKNLGYLRRYEKMSAVKLKVLLSKYTYKQLVNSID